MSYRVHSKKPSLPSIQFIFEDAQINDNISFQQSSSSSSPVNNQQYSTLPSELQQLSISAPIHHEHNKWTTTNKRPASHSRSFSDLTTIKPLGYTPSKPRYQTHRRSISANISTNTIDFFKQQQQQLQHHQQHHQQQQQQQQQQQEEDIERALTESPPITLNELNDLPQQKLLFDALNISSNSTTTEKPSIENIEIKRDEETGKYYCPFCQKSFNRPSSLKIHTYSHTGEKPFVCPIDGCGRQFSVQSNMRRHLRIHKKSKIKK